MPGFLSRSLNAAAMWLADDDGNRLGTVANPLNVTGGGSGGGGGAVTIADGADTAEGATANAAYTDRTGAASGTVVSLLKGLFTGFVGNVASGTADSGNPVKIGGVANTAAPTAIGNGSRADAWFTANGAQVVGGFQVTGGDAIANTNLVSLPGTQSVASVRLLTVAAHYFNGTSLDRARGDTSGGYAVNVASGAAAAALTPVTNTGATSLVVKASAGNFFGGSIVAGATAGFLIAYNAAVAPAAGATLTANLILGVAQVAANGSAALGDYVVPDRASAGIVLLFSTAIATYTVPANAAQFLRGRAL